MSSGSFDLLTDGLTRNAHSSLTKCLKNDPGQLVHLLAELLHRTALHLQSDPETLNRIEDSLANAGGQLANSARPVVGAYVSEVIADWDPKMLIRRFEIEVGYDLQFIRINGAVLGGMIGGVLFVVGRILG